MFALVTLSYNNLKCNGRNGRYEILSGKYEYLDVFQCITFDCSEWIKSKWRLNIAIISKGTTTLEQEPTQHSKPTVVWAYIARHVWLLLNRHACPYLQLYFNNTQIPYALLNRHACPYLQLHFNNTQIPYALLNRHACPYLQLHFNNTQIPYALQQVSDQTVGSKQTHFVGARQSGEINL